MAVLSRSSLRGSVRRTPDSPFDDGPAPPMKRQCTTQENGRRRRRSSPDCLDTTTPTAASSTDKPRTANNPSLKAARPRTSTRRARRVSTTSVDSSASENQLRGVDGSCVLGNGVVKTADGRIDRKTVENAFASDLLRGERESPDPLDMISQSEDSTSTGWRPRASSDAAGSRSKATDTPVSTRATRRNDFGPTDGNTVKEETGELVPRSGETRPVDVTRSDEKAHDGPVESERVPRADGRRSLRSADTGSRCKSELAQYFYNYEQLISLEDPKPELLSAATTVTLIDDLAEPLPIPSTPDPTPFGNPLQQLHNCEVIELSEPALRASGHDPLNEELYHRAHRKFERQEKQLRNIERDRAQHEKQTVERLLEELRSHDWLRVMGLTGVLDSEKKLYEPKRQILIQELVALVNKFQVWKDEERRRKLAKDRPLPTADTDEPQRPRKRSRPVEDVDVESSSLPETPSTPDPNDVDAWAARQLHEEARSASAAKPRKSASDKTKPASSKLDDATITGNKSAPKRQKTLHDYLATATTSATADNPQPNDPSISNPEPAPLAPETLWGYSTTPITGFNLTYPTLEQTEFKPPPDILTPEAIQAAQRRRRRMKRQSAPG